MGENGIDDGGGPSPTVTADDVDNDDVPSTCCTPSPPLFNGTKYSKALEASPPPPPLQPPLLLAKLPLLLLLMLLLMLLLLLPKLLLLFPLVLL